MIILNSIQELLQLIDENNVNGEIIAFQEASKIIPVEIINLIKSLYLSESHQNTMVGGEVLKNYSLRQQQCITLLLAGKTNKQIAKQIGLSVRTVEKYIANIKVKMCVKSRLELVVKFMNTWTTAQSIYAYI